MVGGLLIALLVAEAREKGDWIMLSVGGGVCSSMWLRFDMIYQGSLYIKQHHKSIHIIMYWPCWIFQLRTLNFWAPGGLVDSTYDSTSMNNFKDIMLLKYLHQSTYDIQVKTSKHNFTFEQYEIMKALSHEGPKSLRVVHVWYVSNT